MAHISNSKAVFYFMVFVVGLLFAAGVRAQGTGFPQAPAPAPAPTMDAGAGSMVTCSGAFVCSTLLLYFFTLLRH